MCLILTLVSCRPIAEIDHNLPGLRNCKYTDLLRAQISLSYHSFAVISEGLRVGFQTNRRTLVSNLSALLVPGSVPADFTNLDFVYSLNAEPKRQLYTAYLGSRALTRQGNRKTTLDFIESDLQHTIAKHSRENVFLHAGVIGWRDCAILFPGRSFTGKSTLVRVLIQAGAVYVSDEFARIDARGLVHPFPRPLSFRSSSGRLRLYPEQEAMKVASGPCQVGAIVATRYVAEGAWYPTRLSPGQAALVLLSNTIAVRLDPAKAVRYIGQLASSARAISSPRGDAEATVPLLLETLDRLLD